jgi:CubicO group peptidase (beta-lactamase class C family)
MSTDVLGRIIELVSGMDLDRFVTERVARPLGMHATGFRLVEQKGRRPCPAAPPSGAAPGVLVRLRRGASTSVYSGGAGLLSTAGDYARFCQMR